MIGFPLSLSMNFISSVAFNASAIFSKSLFENLSIAYLLLRFCGVIPERLASSAADISLRSTQHSFIYFVTFIGYMLQIFCKKVKFYEKNTKIFYKTTLQNTKIMYNIIIKQNKNKSSAMRSKENNMTVTKAMNEICKNGNANICHWIGQKIIKSSEIAFIAYAKVHLKHNVCYEIYLVYYAQYGQIKEESFNTLKEAESFFEDVRDL